MLNDQNSGPSAVVIEQSQSGLNDDILAIAGAVILGLALLFAAGFAQASVMHDSAHDMRHAMSFPCH